MSSYYPNPICGTKFHFNMQATAGHLGLNTRPSLPSHTVPPALIPGQIPRDRVSKNVAGGAVGRALPTFHVKNVQGALETSRRRLDSEDQQI